MSHNLWPLIFGNYRVTTVLTHTAWSASLDLQRLRGERRATLWSWAQKVRFLLGPVSKAIGLADSLSSRQRPLLLTRLQQSADWFSPHKHRPPFFGSRQIPLPDLQSKFDAKSNFVLYFKILTLTMASCFIFSARWTFTHSVTSSSMPTGASNSASIWSRVSPAFGRRL